MAVDPLNAHEGAALDPALSETEARGIKPKTLLGESHYGSEENFNEAAVRGAKVIAPAMPLKGSKLGKITPVDFDLDNRG